jgi:signal transduction histidine kinase
VPSQIGVVDICGPLVLWAEHRGPGISYRGEVVLRGVWLGGQVWNEPRPARAPARVWRDWVLLGALPPIAVAETIIRPDLPHPLLQAAVAIGFVPVLLWRRTRPFLVVASAFGLCGVIALASGGAVPQLNTMAFMLILPYTLFRWGSGREAVAGALVVLATVCVSTLARYTGAANVVGGFAIVTASFAAGAAVRFLVRARSRELGQAKLLERERLARDLHDTVAHHVSAIAVRAQAGLAVASQQPGAAVDALQVIAAEASRTLAEMRTMVDVLRRSPELELAPAEGIAELSLLARKDDPPPVVDVEVTGDVGNVPSAVGAAVYRIAQESVTNAQRHARHARRVEVRVVAGQTDVRLRVSDDGDGSSARLGSGGYGLVGMAERARLLGGSCEAGPGSDRGWVVTAVLPRNGPPA